MRRALLLAALCAAAAPAAAKRPALPPYPKALRCAALTEGSATLAKGTSEELQRYDEAVFWGFAASESAQKAKLTSPRFKQDQLDSGAAALAQLKAGDAAAAAELEACRKQVPPLKKPGRR